MATIPSKLEDTIEQARQRVAAERERERALVDEGVASELDLLLRGKPYSASVLRFARGHQAQLRDVMLPETDDMVRRATVLSWLDAEGETAEERTNRWNAYQLVTNNRDSRREDLRLEVARERAGLVRDFWPGVDVSPAGVATTNEPPADEEPPRRNPATFITTLSARYLPDGTRQEWTHLCPMTKQWRDEGKNSDAYRKRVARGVSQLDIELAAGPMLVDTVDADTWRALQEKWKKRLQRGGDAVRWLKLPQEDGSVVVFHDDAGEAGELVPHDTDKLHAMLHSMLWTPQDKRVSSSRAFGGSYTGMRGDGRLREAKTKKWKTELVGQFVTTGMRGIYGAAKTLGIELSNTLRGERELAHADAAEALYLAGYDLKPRYAHKVTLDSVLDALVATSNEDAGENVPYKSHIPDKTIVTYTGHEPPPDDAQLAFVLAEQPPPAPVYLPGGGT